MYNSKCGEVAELEEQQRGLQNRLQAAEIQQKKDLQYINAIEADLLQRDGTIATLEASQSVSLFFSTYSVSILSREDKRKISRDLQQLCDTQQTRIATL